MAGQLILLIICVLLVLLGNAIAIVRSIQNNSLPDPLFLIVDGAVLLYVLSSVV